MAIIVFRGLLGDDEDHSVIGDILAVRQLGEESKTSKFQLDPDESFESAILGHSNLVLDQGPLTVAALGWNPPEGSLHFHLSLLSLGGDAVHTPANLPSPEEVKVIERQLALLNTKNLTVLVGEGLDHALVREKRIEIRTAKPSEAVKNGLVASLPEGDSENELRRFIDDSVNVLAEQEFNRRRIDNGVAPINLCWPWGQGERQRIPNRAIELGFPWMVRTNSLAMRGLAKLSGFQAEKLPVFSEIDLVGLGKTIQRDHRSLTIIDIGSCPADDEQREAFHLRIEELGGKLVGPLLDWHKEAKGNLGFVATNRQGGGLLARCAPQNERDHFPFDERSVTEKRVEWMSLTRLLDLVI